jgi:class 3 adenylate cyclase
MPPDTTTTASHVLDSRTLRFRDPSLELLYQTGAVESVRREARIGSSVSIGLWLLGGILLPSTAHVAPSVSTPTVLVMAGANLAALIPIRRMRTLDDALRLLLVLNILTGTALVALAAQTGLFERYAGPAVMLQSIFALFIARRFLLTAVAGAVEVSLLVAVAVSQGILGGYVLDLFLVVSTIAVGAGATYVIEDAARTGWYQRRLIETQQLELAQEKAKSDRLLRNVLPDQIADRLKEREATIADGVADATVLFADLVGFTPLAGQLAPAEVVRMLDDLFGTFDELTDRLGLEKIKTIGDAYMAAGGVPEPASDHAERVVRLGLAMIDATRAYAQRTGLPLQLRVGVHSGPVVAGVIGHRRLSYDLWGDTVNIASRMESHGVADAVQISQATLDLLGSGFATTPRGSVPIKGKGELETFLVDSGANEEADG